MIKPYLVIMRRSDQKLACYDRSYTFIPDDLADIKACTLDRIVQVENHLQQAMYYPVWVEEADPKSFVSIWFNFYD